MKTMTSTEVEMVNLHFKSKQARIAEAFHDSLGVIQEIAFCHLVLGFYKAENRSPKRLARLKHSMTTRCINGMHCIKWT
jgi:hypothetical protein